MVTKFSTFIVYVIVAKSDVIALWSAIITGFPADVCAPIVIVPVVTADVTLNSPVVGVPEVIPFNSVAPL